MRFLYSILIFWIFQTNGSAFYLLVQSDGALKREAGVTAFLFLDIFREKPVVPAFLFANGSAKGYGIYRPIFIKSFPASYQLEATFTDMISYSEFSFGLPFFALFPEVTLTTNDITDGF